MMNQCGIRSGLLILTVVGMMACGSSQENLPLSGEPITSLVDDGQWEWVRENPSAHRIEGETLHIKPEQGGLMGKGGAAKSIRVRPLTYQPKSVTVRVEAEHETQYEQGGLILYANDDTYLKLVKEQVDGVIMVVMVPEIEAKAVVMKIPWPEAACYVGLEISDAGVVTGSCWGIDGVKTVVGEAEFPINRSTKVGVFTQNGQADADRWITFSEFRLK